MQYLLDANVFIEAKNRYYAFDICPGFWTWMDHVVAGGNIASLTLVRDELLAGNDELKDWVEVRKHEAWFLKEDDAPTQANLARIAQAVQAGPYSAAAKVDFLRGADPWLVAKARTLGASVVTMEVRDPNIKKRVPLPNICGDEGVPWLNTFELLQALHTQFHFKKPPKKRASKPTGAKPSK